MPAQRPHVTHIHHRVPPQAALHAQAVVHGRRYLALHVQPLHVGGKADARRLQHRGHLPVVDGRTLHEGRLDRIVVEHLPLRHPVIEHAEAAAHCRLAVSGHIVGEADPRPEGHAPVLHQRRRHRGIQQMRNHPVGRVAGAGREGADRHRRVGLVRPWIDTDPLPAHQRRSDQVYGLRRIICRRQETGDLVALGERLRQQVKPYPVIERQAPAHVPLVLHKPTDIAHDRLGERPRRRFRVGIEYAQHRIRVRVTRV